MKPGALGEHPAGEDAVLLAGELDLVHLDERGGVRRFRGRAGIADPRRDLQGAELDRLIDGNLQMRDPTRHLIESGEDGDLVLDRLGLGQSAGHSQRHGQHKAGHGKLPKRLESPPRG